MVLSLAKTDKKLLIIDKTNVRLYNFRCTSERQQRGPQDMNVDGQLEGTSGFSINNY
jgi:hypothetical protein